MTAIWHRKDVNGNNLLVLLYLAGMTAVPPAAAILVWLQVGTVPGFLAKMYFAELVITGNLLVYLSVMSYWRRRELFRK